MKILPRRGVFAFDRGVRRSGRASKDVRHRRREPWQRPRHQASSATATVRSVCRTQKQTSIDAVHGASGLASGPPDKFVAKRPDQVVARDTQIFPDDLAMIGFLRIVLLQLFHCGKVFLVYGNMYSRIVSPDFASSRKHLLPSTQKTDVSSATIFPPRLLAGKRPIPSRCRFHISRPL